MDACIIQQQHPDELSSNKQQFPPLSPPLSGSGVLTALCEASQWLLAARCKRGKHHSRPRAADAFSAPFKRLTPPPC
eukprot:365631-Chlamydomonas_euryale.AAC.5